MFTFCIYQPTGVYSFPLILKGLIMSQDDTSPFANGSIPLSYQVRTPWVPVISMTLATPPASPAEGDTYLVPDGATGWWADYAGQIAQWHNNEWSFSIPVDGHGVSLPDGRIFELVGGVYIEKIALDVQSGKWSYAVASGTANGIVATLTPAPTALTDGMPVTFKVTATNTGPVSLNLNGRGDKPIKRQDGSDLMPGDLAAGSIVTLIYDAAAGCYRHPSFMRSDVIKVVTTPPIVIEFTAPGMHTWTVPTGVEVVEAEAWGGGGGGGYTSVGGAPGGGGGGGYGKRRFAVTPGSTFTIVVGSGGAGGSSSRTGQPGLASAVTYAGATMSAGGGTGGQNATAATMIANEGSGGSVTGADTSLRGGNGVLGGYHPGSMLGGYGGPSPNGGYGSPGGWGGVGPGNYPGGGGGATSLPQEGGRGADGKVRITYLG
jgi:hypothetical protein